MEVSNAMRIEKFNGKEFRQWKFQINCALKAKGLNIYAARPTTGDTNQWEKNDGMAMFIITSSMELNQISLIENCETAKEVMVKLESIYEQKSELNKMIVHEKFYQYKMSPTDNIAQHISKVENLAKQLKESGEKISDTAIMTKILSTLPSKYRSLRQAWLSLDPHAQTIQNLTARLLDEEASLTNEEESESALVAVKHTRKQNKSQNGNKSSTSGQHNRHRFVCYNCNKRGHFARDCRAPKKSERVSSQEQNMLAFSAEQCLQSEADTDIWILDSGASAHMSYRRDYFSDLQEYGPNNVDRTVRLGNKKELVVKGHGNVLINRCVNGKWEQSIIEDVLYVPDLHRNLFSEGMATRKGYVIIKKHSEALIIKKNLVVMTATLKENNLYEVNIKTKVQINCNLVQSSLRIWHERLGHLNIKEVQNMSKNGAIPVTVTDDNNFMCEACHYGKQSRLSFHKSGRGQCEAGDLTYSDVCGPMEHTSVSGARYFVLFKDGATSYRHVFMMKHKSDVFDYFKKYNAIVKNKFGHGIRILHTDNGREYINHEFKTYLENEGIIHERTAPYTPEQNGRVEREMRTTMESARSMLYSRDISLNLWAEAVNCSIYLLNRSSSTQTKNVSPYELWNGEKPALGHIRVFGSEGYVHVPDEQRRKLDRKSVKLILVGYENENYRMFDSKTGKITVSRNVRFNENNIPMQRRNITSISITAEKENCQEAQSVPVSSPGEQQSSSKSSFVSIESEDDPNDVSYEPPQMISECDRRNITLRPRRIRNEEANFIEYDIPTTYDEAINCKNGDKWKEAIREELQSLEENKTWKLIDKRNEKTVTSKWVFCVKRNSDGEIERYKARLCARGFTQTKDIDYKETFSPTTRYDSIRIILSLAARENYELQQFDVKTAFLHGELLEDVYMEVPEGVQAEPGKICKLLKSLYGLKQASRCWNRKFSSFLTTYGFEMCPSDNCVFVGNFNDHKVILILYVDDALLLSKSNNTLLHIIKDLEQMFKIKVLNLNMFIGMEIIKSNGSIVISQKQYIDQIIRKFNMSEANPCSTPADNNVILKENMNKCVVDFPYREAVGALMFLSTVSRPDISYALNIVSRYLNNPGRDHVNAVKRIIRYLIKTKELCINYNGNSELIGYSDSDFASDIDSRKSNTGYIFMMNGGPVTWASRKQSTVALSTTESEYMAASEAAKEILWLRQLLIDIREPQLVVTLCIDNQSAIKLIHNPIYHRRTKHIDIKYNFIREKVEQNIISIRYVESSNQFADFLTKALPSGKFNYIRDQVFNI